MRIYFSFFWFMIGSVAGHGKLVDPPARNTVMNTQRLNATGYARQCNTGEINYTDKANFCGGKGTQTSHGGKCSACGDDWGATYPRKHDYGGLIVKKITPVRVYLQGQVITVKVRITASHEGYFEFRLCPKLEGEEGDDDLTKCYQDPSQFRLLQMTDGNTRAEGISQVMLYSYDLQLPKDVNCAKGCNLQWWYRAGNSWGCDEDGSCGTGKGSQEHFVNCADILILTCEQFKSGRFPDWCGYGPSEDLKNCTTDGGSDQGATDSGSESEESDAETKLEPGPGEATGAGEGAGVGSNQGMKPVPPANADKGASTGPAHPFLRVCYYSNWSQYRNGGGKFFPENIDPYLCTHLIYSFAKLANNKLATYEWNDDQLYKRFNQLKETNPDLKTLLAVGGWNFGSTPFSRLAAASSLRKQFASTSVEFLRKHGFDGLDMDWEYPALRGGVAADKENFVLMLQDLKEAFEAEHAQTGNPQLLLTAAVAAGRKNIKAAYDIPGMNKYLDFINLMSYDLHGAWEKFTGHNAPLQEDDPTAELNVDWAARYWQDNGTPADKLIIGLATYGRTFTLSNPSSNGMGAPARGAGSAGQKTGEAGFMAYYEVCEKLSRNEGVKHWDDERRVPYLVAGNQWIGYDDEDSFAAKLQYIRDNNYGGAMVWNIDLDDFQQSCPLSTRRYPLMSLMSEILDSPAGEPTDNKPSGSSSETETDWSSSDGASNTDNNQPGSTEMTGDDNEEWTPSNNDNDNADNSENGGGTDNNWENSEPINNNNSNFNSDNMKTDNVNDNNLNNNENDGYNTGSNNKGTNGGMSPMSPENAPDVDGTISCERCYKTGLPYCDACCEAVMTSEFTGTSPSFDNWCQTVCKMGYCPPSHCKKSEMKRFRQSCDIPSIPNLPGSLSTLPSCEDCQSQGSTTCSNTCCEKRITRTVKGKSSVFDNWCTNNCAQGFCPSSHCIKEENQEWTDICMAALRSLDEILSDLRQDEEKKRHLGH